MAIIQISRIQNRTGNLSDLPQLSAGELGWADDARRLFIGNDISRAGDSSPNNTEILTQYSNISFNQVASIINPKEWDVIQYDAGNAAWVNRQIYLDDAFGTNALTVHGNLSIIGNLFNISNSTLKLTGGSSGDVLTTDGTGNLIWAVPSGGGGGGGGGALAITAIANGTTTPGSSTLVTVTNLAAANGDSVIFNGIVSTGNIATVLNGNVFYVGNVNLGANTVRLYTDLALTTGVATTGTYTSGGNMTVRAQAAGASGAVQLSDGSGHFTTASGLQYSSGLQTLSSPKLSATLTTEDALSSGGGANIAGNLKVNLNANVVGNTRIGGIANVIGNLNVTGNSTITGNVALSNNASITGNVTIGGTASITGNTTITGANVSLGTVANVHIGGGTSQVALAGTISIVGNVITGIAVSSGGAGYLSAPTVIISGGNTIPATATATIVGGVVQTPLTMTAGGAGYDPANTTVTFSLPEPEYLTTDGRGNLAWGAITSAGGAPTGTITMWPTATAPSGYLICNGAAVSRTGLTAALFAILGTTFGVGDGSTTFNIPDYRDKFAMGAGGTIVTAAGQTGGSANAVVVAHTHTATSNSLFSGNALSTHNHTATSVFTGNALGTHNHAITDPGHLHTGGSNNTAKINNPGAGFTGSFVYVGTNTPANSTTASATTSVTVNAATAGTPTGTVATTIDNSSAGVPAGSVATTTTINSAGVSATNQNLPPYLGIYFIIKT